MQLSYDFYTVFVAFKWKFTCKNGSVAKYACVRIATLCKNGSL